MSWGGRRRGERQREGRKKKTQISFMRIVYLLKLIIFIKRVGSEKEGDGNSLLNMKCDLNTQRLCNHNYK